MRLLKDIARFLGFYCRAVTLRKVHSPYLFEILSRAVDDHRQYYAFDAIEDMRLRLLEDDSPVTRVDFGAGSKVQSSPESTVRAIAGSILSSPAQCRFMFRLAEFLNPATVLELGTAFGLSSAYLASACERTATVFTLEGDKSLAACARKIHHELGLTNIQIIEGPFSETLQNTVDDVPVLDLCFIDGHHRSVPTLHYFDRILPKLAGHSVVIFDDIHWSPDMEHAWRQIRQHDAVRATVDCYSFGLAFFSPAFHEKVHLDFLPSRHQPWKYL